MHVLVATDGHLDPATTAAFCSRLAGADGKVTVLTVVEVPRALLADLRAAFGESDSDVLILDHETVETQPSDSPRASRWPGDDAIINRYLDDQREQRTAAIVAALKDAGVDANIELRESEQAARAILEAISDFDADVVCIGSHGRGRFEGLLGSTGTKIARLADVPVLLLRS